MRFVCERKSELNVTVCCCVYLAPWPIMSVDRANKYCRGVHSTEFSVQICTLASYISLSMDCYLVERVTGVTHWVRRLIIGTYIYMLTIWWERLEETLFKLNGFWCISSCLCTCKKTTLFGRLVRFHLKFIFGFFSTSFKKTLNCEVSPFLFLN